MLTCAVLYCFCWGFDDSDKSHLLKWAIASYLFSYSYIHLAVIMYYLYMYVIYAVRSIPQRNICVKVTKIIGDLFTRKETTSCQGYEHAL